MKLTRKKFIVFSIAATALSLVAVLIVLLAVDLVLHARAEKSAGLNRRECSSRRRSFLRRCRPEANREAGGRGESAGEGEWLQRVR